MISPETAYDIAVCYEQIKNAKELLNKVEDQLRSDARFDREQVRDAFGRVQYGLQLGVPSGDNGRRLYNVSWELARPVLQAQIATYRAQLSALMTKARSELDAPPAAEEEQP